MTALVPVAEEDLRSKLGVAAFKVWGHLLRARGPDGTFVGTVSQEIAVPGIGREHVRKALKLLRLVGLQAIIDWRPASFGRVPVRVVYGDVDAGTADVPPETAAWVSVTNSHGGVRPGAGAPIAEVNLREIADRLSNYSSVPDLDDSRVPDQTQSSVPDLGLSRVPDGGDRVTQCVPEKGGRVLLLGGSVNQEYPTLLRSQISDSDQISDLRSDSSVRSDLRSDLPSECAADAARLFALSRSSLPDPPLPHDSTLGSRLPGRARDWFSLGALCDRGLFPPYPDTRRIGVVVVPPPPRLPDSVEPADLVARLRGALRAAVVARTGQRWGGVFSRRSWAPAKREAGEGWLAEGGAALRAFDVPPMAWAGWCVDVWAAAVGKSRRDAPTPPIRWVYDAKRIYERRDWFWRESTAYMGGRVLFGEKQNKLLRRHAALVQRARGTDGSDAAIAAVVAEAFPEGYDAAVAAARAEGDEMKRALFSDVARGVYVW